MTVATNPHHKIMPSCSRCRFASLVGTLRLSPAPGGMMRHAIALNGSFFNTRRVALQYV